MAHNHEAINDDVSVGDVDAGFQHGVVADADVEEIGADPVQQLGEDWHSVRL